MKNKNYTVNVTQVFKFTVKVRAGSKKEAKELVDKGFSFPTLNINSKHLNVVNDPSDKTEEGILDWNIPYHHESITLK